MYNYWPGFARFALRRFFLGGASVDNGVLKRVRTFVNDNKQNVIGPYSGPGIGKPETRGEPDAQSISRYNRLRNRVIFALSRLLNHT